MVKKVHGVKQVKLFKLVKKKGIIAVVPVDTEYYIGRDVYLVDGEEIKSKNINKPGSCLFDNYNRAKYYLSKFEDNGVTLIIR